MKLTLERDRPTSFASIGKLLAVAGAIAIPLVLFVAPLIARYDAETVSVGESVSHTNPETGWSFKGHGTVAEIRGDGTAVIQTLDGTRYAAPVSELHEF